MVLMIGCCLLLTTGRLALAISGGDADTTISGGDANTITSGGGVKKISAPTKKGPTLPNPLGSSVKTLGDVPVLIGTIIKSLLNIIGALALLVIVYGGFTWMTSAGNESKVAQGRNTMLWAAIALAIIFLSRLLVQFLFQALGV